VLSARVLLTALAFVVAFFVIARFIGKEIGSVEVGVWVWV
jgi:hypothetical protein